MRQQVFYLAYHLHWPKSEILSMDTSERWSYVNMLVRRIQEENQAYEALNKKIGAV